MEFNYLDIIVILVILFFAVKGYMLGFVKMCFGFIPLMGAVLASRIISPAISGFIRSTFVYEMMQSGVRNALGIDKLIENTALQTQRNLIDSLQLPSFLKNSLLENNNPVVYEILDVSEIGDYISGYIANVCINVLAVILVFITAYVILKIVISAMDLMSHLPVINFLNTSGGVAAGSLYAIFIIWIASIVLVMFYSNEMFKPIFEALNSSKVALFLYENNLLLFLILKIFA